MERFARNDAAKRTSQAYPGWVTLLKPLNTQEPQPVRNARDQVSLVLFGGKGGTGKTTVAAATAVYQARFRPSKRVLVVSTDMAHSLSDILGFRAGEAPKRVDGVPNLWAMELNTEKLAATFQERLDVNDVPAELDPQDVEVMRTLPLPGCRR